MRERKRERELRIALVCFGGVSLAVYMHGISKEILKLVCASSLLHSIGDRTQRFKGSFFDKAVHLPEGGPRVPKSLTIGYSDRSNATKWYQLEVPFVDGTS